MFKIPSIHKLVFTSPFRKMLTPQFKFSSQSVIDVLRLEQDNQGYFINFPGRTMPLSTTATISDAQIELLQKYGFGELEFSNSEDKVYSASTPISILIQDDFYITLEKQKFFIVNTGNSQNLQLGLLPSFEQDLNARSVQEISNVPKETVDNQHIQLILQNSIYKLSFDTRKRVERIQQLIELVESQLSKDLSVYKDVNDTHVQKKLRRFFKGFFALVIAQVAFVQYGTYYFLSWDCMEPVTCLLQIYDAILAYSYYLFVHSPYSYETLSERKTMKIKRTNQYKKKFDEQDLFEKKDILDYLYRQKLFHSSSLENILLLFQKKEDLLQVCSESIKNQS